MLNINSKIRFHNGQEIPALGLGTFEIAVNDSVYPVVKQAIESGYRLFDTAQGYKNEAFLGEAIKEIGIDRSELFITTKVWQNNKGYDAAFKSVEESLQKLQTDYVDLVLIHWPWKDSLLDTWKALERAYQEKLAKSIGVSNFHVNHLELLASKANEKPVLNQIEIHPYLSQIELVNYLQANDIVAQSWSPLGHGGAELTDLYITQLAEKYYKTAAQIILRWHLQRGLSVIPKSATLSRIQENSQLYDFSLSDEEVLTISHLNKDTRWGPNPDVVYENSGFNVD